MDQTSRNSLFGALLAAIVIVALVVAYYMIDIDQTQEAKLPDVDVTVEGGQAPKFKVETGDVDVGTTKKTVKVPDVDVKMKETEITVPTVDVKPPAGDDN